jgi:hypothetical protein
VHAPAQSSWIEPFYSWSSLLVVRCGCGIDCESVINDNLKYSIRQNYVRHIIKNEEQPATGNLEMRTPHLSTTR